MVLFVNGCVREGSRTLRLAKAVLAKQTEPVQQVDLYPDGPEGLTPQTLPQRDALVAGNDLSHPMLRWARDFAQADTIVIAAPFWDLLFPAKVRAYLEAVTVSGITFRYGSDGRPQGLCRAKQLIYVTTAGGPIHENFAFSYVQALARNFYGIPQVTLVKAEGLDIWGADAEGILAGAIRELDAPQS